MSHSKYKINFIRISKTCEAVICCRVSPGQKAEVVKLIKDDDPNVVTLSIGDGANDVPMIREAHVGIGLYGNEGMIVFFKNLELLKIIYIFVHFSRL